VFLVMASPLRPTGKRFGREQALLGPGTRSPARAGSGLKALSSGGCRAVNDLLLIWSGVAAGERVLEVGCGTGAFTVPLAEAAGEHGEVLGADISAGAHASAFVDTLTEADGHRQEARLRNVTLTEADGHRQVGAPRWLALAHRGG
jgi:tRNA G46 methylase TrmB